ncbi:MAG: RnfABCDGE type electron transport complex subunit G [Oscillospiraceae bacterium]|nr:RnfABCDGE type electron transport complex subunit G [Oscillospiraceae bacterium]
MSAEKANRTPAKPKLAIDPQYVLRITGVLLGICLITALLLGLVNQVTAPRIDAIQAEKVRAAMSQVLPADNYEPLGFTAANVTAIYQAVSDGKDIGWVVETSTAGSQGAIEMMVGINAEGKVTGVSIVKHSETPNIGTKVVGDQAVLDRFTGMSLEAGEITVNGGANRFDGVSGATVSSRGVATGVNAALAAIGITP